MKFPTGSRSSFPQACGFLEQYSLVWAQRKQKVLQEFHPPIYSSSVWHHEKNLTLKPSPTTAGWQLWAESMLFSPSLFVFLTRPTLILCLSTAPSCTFVLCLLLQTRFTGYTLTDNSFYPLLLCTHLGKEFAAHSAWFLAHSRFSTLFWGHSLNFMLLFLVFVWDFFPLSLNCMHHLQQIPCSNSNTPDTS